MSQNGAWPGPPSHPWSRGNDEPYTEPADPWGEPHSSGEPSWQPPSQSYPHGYAPLNDPPPGWGTPPPAPEPRRNTPLVALVVVLAALAAAGLTASALLLHRGGPAARGSGPSPSAAVTSAAASPADRKPAQDARFVKRGQCVENRGTSGAPVMTIVACGPGTFQVLRRIDGRTTGQSDAEAKCAKVSGYTKWYFYDSELDSLDFVLCLRER